MTSKQAFGDSVRAIAEVRVTQRVVFRVLLGVALAALPLLARSQVTAQALVTDGIEVYYGFVPAAITRYHPAGHPERSMHGRTARAAVEEHLIVALFDGATKQRIENAEIKATVGVGDPHAQTKTLERMRIADTVTYGNYFALPAPGGYHIDLQIRVPGRAEPVWAKIVHQRR